VQCIDNVADALIVEQGDFSRSKRNKISLRNYKPPSIRQLNGKRLKPIAQSLLDIVSNHLRDLIVTLVVSQIQRARYFTFTS